LFSGNHLHGSTKTVTGFSLEEESKSARRNSRQESDRPTRQPLKKTGGLVVLKEISHRKGAWLRSAGMSGWNSAARAPRFLNRKKMP